MELTGERHIPGLSTGRSAADHLARYEFAAPHAAGRDVMDIACGSGYGAAFLKEHGAKTVVGIDVAEDSVTYAREHFAAPGISFECGNLETLEDKDRFDVITCFETIEHVADYQGSLRRLYAALRPGGTLILSTPNRLITSPNATSLASKPANPFHIREFTPPDMRRFLEEAGFASANIAGYGQRQQRYFRSWPGRVIYKFLMDPASKTSPAVTPMGKLQPRYMVFVAKK